MKNLLTTSLIAAALMAVAGSASAQTLSAEIPFRFRVGEKWMTPGTYRVVAGHSALATSMVRVVSQDDKNSTAVSLTHTADASKEWLRAGAPLLAFECIDSLCTLAKIWTTADRSMLVLRKPKYATDETAKLTVITLRAVHAE